MKVSRVLGACLMPSALLAAASELPAWSETDLEALEQGELTVGEWLVPDEAVVRFGLRGSPIPEP